MSMPINLVLVRHGESEGNVANKRSRKGDHGAFTKEFLRRHSSLWRLTPRGVEQAETTGKWIRDNFGHGDDRALFDRYYVSEYVRALETAGHLAFPGAVWRREFYLRERDWGQLDVMSSEERRTHFAEELARRERDGFFWAPPGGESMATMCPRGDRVFDTLHRECSDQDIIIVCHGEVMWGIDVRLTRMTQARYRVLDASEDPKDHVHDCQVIQYTRRNPVTGELVRRFEWRRSVCPSDLSLSRNEWEPIVRPQCTNEDLLAEVEAIPRLVEG